eukprot:194413-Rhodomonas_salina.2
MPFLYGHGVSTVLRPCYAMSGTDSGSIAGVCLPPPPPPPCLTLRLALFSLLSCSDPPPRLFRLVLSSIPRIHLENVAEQIQLTQAPSPAVLAQRCATTPRAMARVVLTQGYAVRVGGSPARAADHGRGRAHLGRLHHRARRCPLV